jgi:hypothetical protein
MASASVTIGSIITATIAVFTGSLPAIALYLAIFVSGGSLPEYLVGLGTPEYKIAGGLIQIVFSIGSLVGGYLLLETMLKRAGLFHYSGSRRYFRYIGQGILVVFGIALGSVLLLVPGIILAVRWVIAAPLLVGTGTGAIDGIQQSWRLTAGHGWKIFVAALPLGLILLVFIGASAALAGEAEGMATIVIQNAASELLSVITAALSVAVFGLVASPTGEISEIFA